MRPVPGHDHRHVVAAAREVAIQHAGDEAGMALEEPGIASSRAVARPSECITSTACSGQG